MTMNPIPKSRHTTTDELVTVNPHDLVLPEDPADLDPTTEFVSSVERDGVLMAPLVARRDGGALVVVAGRRRVMAARSAGDPILVRIVEGDDTEMARLAIVEDQQVGRKRSTIEQAWMVGAYIRAVEATGPRVSVRSLAAALHVAPSRAHYWLRIARGLPHDRLERLAARVGADPTRLRAIPVTQAVLLAKTSDDDAAEAVLRSLLDRPSSAEQSEGGALAWVRRILRYLMSLLRAVLPRRD